MVYLPLIERKLRVAFRKQRPAQSRLKFAALAAGVAVLFILVGAMNGGRGVGRNLEQLLCLAGLYCVLRVPAMTAGILAEERQNQTLGLLFLSGLGAWEVFAGKFISSALLVFTNLLAIFPMLALPFLIGGVSFNVFVATVCALPILMLFSLAVSLLASVLTREEGVAVVLSFVFGTILCVLTPTIYYAQLHFSPGSKPSLWWCQLSPAYGPHLLWRGLHSGFPTVERVEFWRNMVMTLCLTGLILATASLALARLWREREVEESNNGWRERWSDFLHGSSGHRRRLAESWLDLNPFVWLAGRDRSPTTLGWLVCAGISLLWLTCCAAWPSHWPSAQNFFITATCLNLILAWLCRYTVASQVAQPRRDGSYELLLTTALPPGDIVWGTLEAVRIRVRPVADFVLLLNGLMMVVGLAIRPWTPASLMVYLLLWIALLAWTLSIGRWQSGLLRVMWVSLNCARPALAVWRSSGLNTWSWIWIVFNLQSLGRQFGNFPTGSTIEIIVISCVVVGVLVSWLGNVYSKKHPSMHQLKWNPQKSTWLPGHGLRDSAGQQSASRLIAEFREIVREPLPDPTDPRFKRWNVRERFPWGWEIVQQQLHERLARK
jgi:ABC-type transport system involved in multi-copper enzyme maturation permease subunit